jgi:hypothetical protein
MFKLTGKSGFRAAQGGGGSTPRVQGLAEGRGTGLAAQVPLRPAFLPATPQESTMDSNSPRLQGLEQD